MIVPVMPTSFLVLTSRASVLCGRSFVRYSLKQQRWNMGCDTCR